MPRAPWQGVSGIEVVGITYLFFNSCQTLDDGRDIVYDNVSMTSLGDVEAVKNLLTNVFGKLTWEVLENRSWEGWNGLCEPYLDLNLHTFDTEDVYIVSFRKASTAILKKALEKLEVNNVFADGQDQIIHELRK